MNAKKAVLLMAYGGPDTLADIEPYLLDVRGGRATSPELIHEITERYAAIGGGSPLLEITRRQALALENELNRREPGCYQVFVGMRHWKPYIQEAVCQIAQTGITRVTAMCMTPFASRMSTGIYYEHLQRAVESQDPNSAWRTGLSMSKVDAWYARPSFVSALAANLKESKARLMQAGHDQPFVLFSAHSLPSALAEQGDPYASQFAHLSALVSQAAGLQADEWQTCFQSAGAQNTRWLGPALEDVIEQLAADGKKTLLVSPVGFLSDHVEVLYDIDIEAQRHAAEAGVTLARTVSLNDQPEFIQALAEIIQTEEFVE